MTDFEVQNVLLEEILKSLRSQLSEFCSTTDIGLASMKERLDHNLQHLCYVDFTNLDSNRYNKLVCINKLATVFLNLLKERVRLKNELDELVASKNSQTNLFRVNNMILSKSKKRRNTAKQNALLTSWYKENRHRPYIKRSDFQPVADRTGLSVAQVQTW